MISASRLTCTLVILALAKLANAEAPATAPAVAGTPAPAASEAGAPAPMAGGVAASKTEETKNYIVDFDQDFYTRTPYSKWMRDPFKNPPGFAKVPNDQTTWPKLEAINMGRNNVPYAVLDGKRYKEGQFLDQNRFISNIGANFVTISEGNYDYELVVKVDNKDGLAYGPGSGKPGNSAPTRLPASVKKEVKQ